MIQNLLISLDPVIYSKTEISRKQRKVLSSDVVLLMNKPYTSYHTEQDVARVRNSDSSDESSDDLSESLGDSSSNLY